MRPWVIFKSSILIIFFDTAHAGKVGTLFLYWQVELEAQVPHLASVGTEDEGSIVANG